MNWFGCAKRLLSLLLCCAMLLGMMPGIVLRANAEETVLDAAIFCSDVHGSTSDLKSVLAGVKTSGVTYSSIGFVGDTCLTVANTQSTVNSALGYTPTVMFSYAKSHDTESGADIANNWNYSGEVAGVSANYLVYTIRETDMQNASDAATAAPAFTTWYNGLTDAQKALPIFIMSHRPLHAGRNDNLGAASWYDVIEAAANTSDIVVFWGHNHTSETQNKTTAVDQAAYYVPNDGTESISVANGGTEYPNFTYMNAGYINANNQSPARIRVATTVQITADSLVFQDYTTTGEFTGTYAHNVTVEREFAASEPEVTLSSIAVTTMPTKVAYTVGEEFTSEGMVVTAYYSDDTTAEVTDYTVSGYDMTTAGTQTVTVTYEGKTDTFDITVSEAAPTLSSIAVTTMPTKVAYTVGEEFTSEGMVVTATYSDGETAPVEGYTLSEVDMTTAGTQTVTVTYEGLTATFDITVSEDVPVVTLESIAVSGKTRYTIGDEKLELTVTASYDNGTTADVTADSEFSGCDLTASGVYTVTVSYEGKEAAIDVTVAAHYETEASDVIEVVSQGVTGVTATWDEAAEAVLEEKALFDDYVVYAVTMDNYTEDTSTEYAMTIPEGMDTTNLGLYHVAEDGTLTEIPYVIENDCIVFTTTLTGTFAYGALTLDEDYVLDSIAVSNALTDYHVGDSLYTAGDFTVTATYKLEGAEDSTRVILPYEENNNPDGYTINMDSFDMTVAGAYNVEITYNGVSTTFPIHVWGETFEDATGVTVTVGEGEYGVTTANVAKSENENVAAAVEGKLNEGYVAYDITLSFADGYATNENEKTVTLPIPEGVTNPVVYYVPTEGDAEKMPSTVDGENVTFTTTHFSTYVVGSSTMTGENAGATVPGTPSTTTEQWVLTSTLTAGQTYLIVDANSGTGHVLVNNNGAVSSVEVEINADNNDNMYIVLDNAAAEWTVGGNYTFVNNSKYLGWTDSGSNNYSLALADSANTWTKSGDTLSGPTWQTTSSDGCGGETEIDHTGYLAYSNDWTISETSDNIYYYTKGDVTTGGSEETTYGINITLDGKATQGIDAAFVKENDTLELGTAFTPAQPSGGTYTWTSSNTNVATVDANGKVTFTGTNGTTLIQVKYTWTVGENTYTISNYTSIKVTGVLYDMVLSQDGKTAAPETIAQRNVKNGTTLQLYALATMQTNETTTETATPTSTEWYVYLEDGSAADSIAYIDQTGKLTFTGAEGTIKVMVACVMGGETYNDIVTINVRQSNAVTPGESTTDFPRWPNPGAVRFDKTATAIGNFSETGIAQVELSMAGIPTGGNKPFDVVLVLDLSNSMQQSSRTTYLIAAAKAFMETICLNEDGTWNGLQHGVSIISYNIDTEVEFPANSTTAYTDDMKDITSLDDYNDAIDAIDGLSRAGGTDYADALKHGYEVLNATKDPNRDQYLIFMSDGAPTSYAYLATSQVITSDKHTESTIATGVYTDEDGNSYNAYLVDQGTSTGSTYELATSTLVNYDEYYSYLMKQNGVNVYSVGLAISDSSDKTILSHISSAGASETATANNSHAFFISDGDSTALTNAFVQMGTEMMAAATNVSVEDAVTDEYEVIFDLPNDNIEGVPSTIDDFYIEVVEYPLDDTTHERTGETKILQRIYLDGDSITKITYTNDAGQVVELTDITPSYSPKAKDTDKAYFLEDGTYKPDGDGTHHMTSGAKIVVNEETGKITLFTPNFVYDEATKKLNWTVASMSETSETALRYFVYLKNSGGVDADQQIDPGTYPTNKYATLNYTNHLGNECEQIFPVPQMTWNGAQVSYVFYLVNEEGKPVNRAGREITFAEAIFVTDVHTFEIVWNDLEQSAGLEAEYLAKGLLPEDYRLYDENAYYKIHVYEDEAGSNLNNHFILAGTDGDTTTYVYNNKTDVNKYNIHGTYAANSIYLCKSYNVTATVVDGKITDAEFNGEVGVTQMLAEDLYSTTNATIINGYVYYIDENGDVYTIIQKTRANELEGFDFANTTVAFAVVWEKKLVEDTVVVDFGLPVDIDVVSNDFVYNYINGISASDPNYGINEGFKLVDEGTGYVPMGQEALTIQGHTVAIKDQNHIRFTPGSTVFDEPVKFFYETIVEAYEESKVVDAYMYSSVTVIPATTVYYEDSFVTFTSVGEAQWSTEGTTTSATQSQDRPGESKISEDLDADYAYGYDKAYENCSTYSMGSAKKITVTPGGNYGTAEFEFYGTGFDVISMTSNTTGSIVVRVYPWNGSAYNMDAPAASYIVDTYYGYTYDSSINTDVNGDGEVNDEDRWKLSPNTPNSLYQVPVMKIEGLKYGRYKAVITCDYLPMFDHNGTKSYDFYLDAIRIYDPAGDTLADLNETEKNAYAADGELLPNYYELRNWLISKDTFDSAGLASVNGIVFIDSNDAASDVADYSNYGPNNELYLAPGQAVAFNLNASNESGKPDGYVVDQVHIAYKSVGGTAYVQIFEPSNDMTVDTAEVKTVNTATDLYVDITDLDNGNVVISNAGNTGDAILSITNVKVTYKEPAAAASEVAAVSETGEEQAVFSVNNETATVALMSLRRAVVEETPDEETTEPTEPEVTEPEVPETTEPEATEPEVPETTEPEATEPEVPETSEPEVTEPETTEPEETEPENNYQQTVEKIVETAKKVYNFISNLFSRWF